MDFDQPDDLSARVRTMQIIVVALTMGPTIFLAIVSFATQAINMGNAFGGLPLLTLIGIGLVAFELAARAIVIRTMVAKARRDILHGVPVFGNRISASADDSDPATQLVALYQTRMIVSAALLEGAAFFLIIAYMVEHSPWALAAAIALIVAVAVHFPTQARANEFVERQLAILEEERQLGPNL